MDKQQQQTPQVGAASLGTAGPNAAISADEETRQQQQQPPVQQQQVQGTDLLTPLILQQLQQAPPSTAQEHSQAVANPSVWHSEAFHGSQAPPSHHRSPLGPAVASSRKDSTSSTGSSMALLGRMSGVSLPKPEPVGPVSTQQQQQQQEHAQEAVSDQAAAQLHEPMQAAAAVQGLLLTMAGTHAGSGGTNSSSSSRPPLSPNKQSLQPAGAHATVSPLGNAAFTAHPADSAAASALANMLPLAPQSLGLPTITTTLPVPIPGSNTPSGAGVSPRGLSSPRPAAAHSPGITPQDSVAVPLSHAASLAFIAASTAQQQQQQQQQQTRVASVAGTMDSDNSLDSSSDDDDNYEFGEVKIKRSFSRQQRRERRQQALLAHQQQQAAAQQHAQVQAMILQQQQQQAELQAHLQQQAACASRTLSFTAQAGSPSAGGAEAATAGAMGSVAASALLASGLKSSPPDTPTDVVGSSLGSVQGAAGQWAPAPLQQHVAEQHGEMLPVFATQPQQQQHQAVGLPAAAAIGEAAGGEQGPCRADWAAAAVGMLTAAAAAGATTAAAAAPCELSFTPALDQRLSQASGVSGVSGVSKGGGRTAGSSTPVVGSAGETSVAAAVCQASPTAGSTAAAAAEFVLGSGRVLGGGSVGDGDAGSGPSFLSRQQGPTGGVGGGGDAPGVAGGSGGGADATAKGQSELKAEFQGLSLFNEEDDDDEVEGEEERPRWHRRPMMWLRIVAFGLSAVLLLMGILTQNVSAMSSVNHAGVDLFRWFYFFSLWPILWVIVRSINNKLFTFVEWWFYREALCSYLDSVRRTARNLIFMCLILPWFVACFWKLWCDHGECDAEHSYKQATDVVWKLMICLTLFSLANFLKSVLTKLLSSHFYRSAHFKKVKDAIEKEYWLLMLSQPRPAPKPVSEPPLSRLSHFIYNGSGNQGGGADDGQPNEPGCGDQPAGGPAAGGASDLIGAGSLAKLRRRNRLNRASSELPKSRSLLPQLGHQDNKPPEVDRAVSCGVLDTWAAIKAAAAQSVSSRQHSQADMGDVNSSLNQHGLTLSRTGAASLAGLSPGSGTPVDATGQLSPDFTARIVVSGFNIEATELARSSPHLEASPSAFTAMQPGPAGVGVATEAVGCRVVSLSTQLQPQAQQQASSLAQSRSSSLRWGQDDGVNVTANGAAGAAAGAGNYEVDLQPFKSGADRLNLLSASDADADENAGQRPQRWGFWRRAASGQQQLQLLPEGHSPSSPASQHTLVIQDTTKPVEGSSTSRHLSGMLSSVFASPTAQQPPAVSRLNSELSRRPGSVSVPAEQRRSTDVAGAAGSISNAAGPAGATAGRTAAAAAAAAAAAGTAAAGNLPSDPLLQPGVLEAVNLKVDGKAVDTSTIRPAEWERLRAGIALKTFTALMKRYQNLSDAEEIKKLRDARRFAKGLFYHLRGFNARPYIVRDDFTPFFGSKESADAAFGYFDKDNDATLTLKEMKDSVVAIFKERKNMAASLKDTDSIVKTLEFGIGFLLHFIFAALYLLVWGMDIVKGFSTFSATVLALTFVFGNSVRQIYESMLFLFVEHAFDVGDLLEVEMIAYRVKKIDLMYTVLVKSTGERCYYPNVRLITLPVINLTRSCARSEKVVISLDIGQATNAARETLMAAVKEHYEENESDFNSCPSVNFVNLVDPFKVQMSVSWTYNFGADETKRTSTVKTGLLQAVHSCLGSLPILEYTLVKDLNGTGGSDGSDGRGRAAASMGAGVAEQQAAQAATLGAAVLGGTAMMGASAGLAVL